jgi:hypothetical protein
VTVVFTDHARMRYRRRIPAQLRVDLDVIAREGRIRTTCPLQTLEDADGGYLVHGEAVFPLVRSDDDLVAVTCLRRRRMPKADRRALRALTQDDLFMEAA